MQEPKILGIIPARWGSTRFPGKPLHNIAGKPLIQHVWERAKESKLIEKVILDPQKKNRLIFDGYPRTIDQAKNLDLLLNSSKQKIDFIFFLNVDKDTIIKRIKKRKFIEKRSDDELDIILKRYDTYMETTRPVLEYYSTNSNFHEIDGSLEIDQITNKIEAFLTV